MLYVTEGRNVQSFGSLFYFRGALYMIGFFITVILDSAPDNEYGIYPKLAPRQVS
jgi:hypothetical protein